MITRLDFVQGSAAAAALVAVPHASERAASPKTALDRYIELPTPEYRYDIAATIEAQGHRTRIVSMVSQRWRDSGEVDQPLWKHWLTLTEPRERKTSVAALLVSGGSRGDAAPHDVDPVIGALAVQTGAVFAELHGVPNQPLVFAREGRARGEDDLVAYSWDRFLRTGDDTWPLRLPMTKAVVRAMDTVTALCEGQRAPAPVDRFVVGGASKRGWTTWLTPAVDRRVVGIVPVVIDVLNVQRSAEHAFRVYGAWPPSLEAYERMGIMRWLGTPELDALLRIEDPYAYRDRIAVPKLIVNATGDQFFTPDSSQFYFGELRGDKYLRYLPNTDHSLSGAGINAAPTGLAFLDSIMHGTPRPSCDWTRDPDGTLRVRSAAPPASVKLWQATNRRSRDFRLQTIGRSFTDTDLHDEGGYTYSARVTPPRRGFTASFVELTYKMAHDDVFTVTTDVAIVPDVLPYAPPRPMAAPS